MIRTSADPNVALLAWRRSSYSSSGDGNDCVEIAAAPGAVHVRDSKDVAGARLALAPRAWACFVAYAAARR
ncbi:DUF397 domain-containing protein [Streptomyces montanisoli]|uniref:DUF397 domain-containing protein n=1 Tax=Streptomyces montanisoli TaxID=2798581 RepID=A0A940MI34_9ACTN|nr:DUF397 domain-containing protein [Streptomyces montanisoli]MBP0461248.1 DUF397 domain-containing protein [Streptomyces montanisoli]